MRLVRPRWGPRSSVVRCSTTPANNLRCPSPDIVEFLAIEGHAITHKAVGITSALRDIAIASDLSAHVVAHAVVHNGPVRQRDVSHFTKRPGLYASFSVRAVDPENPVRILLHHCATFYRRISKLCSGKHRSDCKGRCQERARYAKELMHDCWAWF